MSDPMTGNFPSIEEMWEQFPQGWPVKKEVEQYSLENFMFAQQAEPMKHWYASRGYKMYPQGAPFLARTLKQKPNTRFLLTYPTKRCYVVLCRGPENFGPPTVEYNSALYAAKVASALKRKFPESTFVVAQARRSVEWWDTPNTRRGKSRGVAPRPVNSEVLVDAYRIVFSTDEGTIGNLS